MKGLSLRPPIALFIWQESDGSETVTELELLHRELVQEESVHRAGFEGLAEMLAVVVVDWYLKFDAAHSVKYA